MTHSPVLVWFRNDLRMDDHPALSAAASGAPVVALFVLDPALDSRPLGGAAQWWLHHSLAALREGLAAHGVPLVLRRGPAAATVAAVAGEAGASTVFWNRGTTPFLSRADAEARTALAVAGVAFADYLSDLIVSPDAIRTGSGQPYRVFTPFWRALARDHAPAVPVPPPARLRGPDRVPRSDRLEDWGLLPTRPDWAGGLRETWTPGETGAHDRLQDFLDDAAGRYGRDRNLPGTPGTSRLSPHLRFGEISVRRVWHTTASLLGDAAEAFLREVAWREFSHHLLFQQPALDSVPLRPEFARFPWRDDDGAFAAWSTGRTGYPIVDAGMRELWHTGWMHNRVRMIAASFLVKDLLLPWQWGEQWFWDTLVDACPANNPAGWQWVAGCGSDAAPYFRVFNPVLQGEKFDQRGSYVRRWLPEISGRTDAMIHHPAAAHDLLADYPPPMVDHGAARRRALAAYEAIKAEASSAAPH